MSKAGDTGQINILADRFLVERLKCASFDAVEKLFGRLLDNHEGRLATGAAVRTMVDAALKNKLFTEGALEVFVAELQHYGGNAALNVFRGAGVPYAQILNDTLDHLGFEGTRDQQIDLLEGVIVRREIELLWMRGNTELQARLAKAVATKASLKAVHAEMETAAGLLALTSFLCDETYEESLLHTNAQLPGDSSGVGGRLLAGWVGKALVKAANELTPKETMGKLASVVSSHRVTLPCINHLVRMRLVQQLGAECTQAPEPAAQPHAPAGNVIQLSDRAGLVVRNSDGHDTLAMTDLPIRELPPGSRRVPVNGAKINRLSPLLQAAPTAMMAAETGGERFMKVVVSGPLAMAKDGDGFRGFVKGPDGKITEHVRLFDGELSQVVNAAALFNVASFALAQKHLADISARLDDIQQGVDRVSTFQRRQREAQIAGAIQYLRQIAEPILAGEMRDALEHQLEDAESRLLDVQNHLKADIEGTIRDLADARDEGKFGIGAFRDKLVGLQHDFDESVHQWKLCVAARMTACRLLCNFQGAARTVEAREKSIREDLRWLLGPDGAIQRMIGMVESRLTEFTAWGDSKVELQASKETLRIGQQALIPALQGEVQALSAQFEALMHETRAPVELIVSTRNGQIAELAVL